jgi:DNA helicase HerA-like ATPase
MDAARLSIFRSKPLLVVVDEAHQFLQNILLTEDQSYPLDSFGLIAKEGRKYSLNICLVTQRPRDIPEDLLSQMGTMLVHRLINQQDLSIVERAAGGAHARLAASLPTLRTGEAVVLGVDFPLPVKLKILQPSEPPDSQGPDYQTHWS